MLHCFLSAAASFFQLDPVCCHHTMYGDLDAELPALGSFLGLRLGGPAVHPLGGVTHAPLAGLLEFLCPWRERSSPSGSLLLFTPELD